MIRSFRHTGIERFSATGSKAGIQPKHAAKLRDQLTLLNIARRPEEMNLPGWQWHALRAGLADHWTVSANMALPLSEASGKKRIKVKPLTPTKMRPFTSALIASDDFLPSNRSRVMATPGERARTTGRRAAYQTKDSF